MLRLKKIVNSYFVRGFVAVEASIINIEHEENTENFGERNLSEKARFCVIEIADIFQKSWQQ